MFKNILQITKNVLSYLYIFTFGGIIMWFFKKKNKEKEVNTVQAQEKVEEVSAQRSEEQKTEQTKPATKAVEKKEVKKTTAKTTQKKASAKAAPKQTKTAAKPAQKQTKAAAKPNTKKTEPKPATKKTETKPVAKKAETKPAVKEEKRDVYRVSYDKVSRTWLIKKDGARRTIASFQTKEEAMTRVKQLSASKDANVVVHKKDGKFQKKA